MGLSGLRENLEERRIFPRSSGCEGSIFAAELPAPSKLQQWGCASFDISATRSPGASKDPQGAGQASKYVHCGSKGFKESQRGAARRGSVGFSKGFGAYSKMFAAELAAPSKLQQWAGASCKISAARSPGASKNPQGASQASTYFAVRATVKSLGLSGLRENLEERQIFPRCEGSTYLRRSCPRLQNFRAARASIYLLPSQVCQTSTIFAFLRAPRGIGPRKKLPTVAQRERSIGSLGLSAQFSCGRTFPGR